MLPNSDPISYSGSSIIIEASKNTKQKIIEKVFGNSQVQELSQFKKASDDSSGDLNEGIPESISGILESF